MDKINGLNQIVELLQNRLSQKAAEVRKSPTDSASKSKNSPPPLKREKKISIKALEEQISNKINHLQKSDPAFQRKAIKIFIDDTVSWEFGADILDSPDFIQLRKNLEQAMRENATLHDKFGEFIGQLVDTDDQKTKT